MAMTGRKPLPKSAVLTLKPGALIRIMWNDAPDEVVMLVEKPAREKGEISLKYIHSGGVADSHATNRQVVEVVGHVHWSNDSVRVENRFECTHTPLTFLR